jgi:type IV pilus assembly protein PilC
MEYSYTAYTKDRKLVKGKLSADNADTANRMLDYGGYQVVTLKPASSPFYMGNLTLSLGSNKVSSKDILLFSRQLALLLESGTDLVNAVELIQKQSTVKSLQRILEDVIHDVQSGSSFSSALGKHPEAFSTMYVQAMAAGEQAGNLDIVLRQMADYLDREVNTRKKVKSALTYPILIFVLAIIVVGVLSIYVMPTFVSLFSAFGANLPLATKLLMGVASFAAKYGIYIMIFLLAAIVVCYAYIRTPAGRLQWDTISLQLPMLGRINVLGELSRCCRTMSLLYKVGLPLPDILSQVIKGSNNKAFANALKEVQEDLIRGEGLSGPMSKNKLFLPLMVQMIAVGEETGNLDSALTTVAVSYETEADDRTSTIVGLIQPTLTIGIALVVGFVAIAMISAMYGVYGQVSV